MLLLLLLLILVILVLLLLQNQIGITGSTIFKNLFLLLTHLLLLLLLLRRDAVIVDIGVNHQLNGGLHFENGGSDYLRILSHSLVLAI